MNDEARMSNDEEMTKSEFDEDILMSAFQPPDYYSSRHTMLFFLSLAKGRG
jgi:hypothetical protein